MKPYCLCNLTRWLGFGALLLVLTACLKFDPVPAVPQQRYVIKQLPMPRVTSVKQAQPLPITLLVAPMVGNAVYNTTKLLYVKSPYQINAFAEARWADLPAAMLQALLVESLQQSQRYRAVVTAPFAGAYQQQLNTTLLYLAQEMFPGQAPRVRVSVLAEWVDVASGKVIAMKKFTVVATVPAASPYGTVKAINQACAKLLAQIVGFSSNKGTR